MKKVKVLIIFELEGESTTKAIVDMNAETYELFSPANNYFVNESHDKDHEIKLVNTISFSLMEPSEINFCINDLTEMDKQWFGKFHGNIVNDLKEIRECEKVIHCGIWSPFN